MSSKNMFGLAMVGFAVALFAVSFTASWAAWTVCQIEALYINVVTTK